MGKERKAAPKGGGKKRKAIAPNALGQREARRPGQEVAGVAELVTLWESQGGRCALCGEVLTFEDAEIDHVVAVRSGGTHTIGNLQIVHREVNQMKGAMGNKEFLSRVREIYEHYFAREGR